MENSLLKIAKELTPEVSCSDIEHFDEKLELVIGFLNSEITLNQGSRALKKAGFTNSNTGMYSLVCKVLREAVSSGKMKIIRS